MLTNYGYSDGSGTFLITIDTDRCDGCGNCFEACPYGILEVVPNEFDPIEEDMIVVVTEDQRKKIKYACSPCKSYLNSVAGIERQQEEINKLPCVVACATRAITHSW